MAYKILVYILYPTDDLLEVELSLILIYLVVLNEIIEFSLRGQLHNDEDIVGSV